MTRDADLDVMNIVKELPEENASFYFRSSEEDGDGFYYYRGEIEKLANALLGLMEQDENIFNIVVMAINEIDDGAEDS